MGAHLPGWKAVADRAQVTMACDVNEESARKRAGEVGGDVQVCKDWRQMEPGAWGWRGSATEAGGGCALDTGNHPTYMLISIANSEPVEVVSMSDNYNQPYLEAEDTAQTMARFANGAVGTLQTSWA